MKIVSFAPVVLIALLGGGACSSDVKAKREQYLHELHLYVITPKLDAMAAAFSDLDGKVEALIATPNGVTLAAAQSSWRTARGHWKNCEMFLLGPTMASEIRPSVDWFPIDTAKLELNLAGDAALDAAFVQASGSNLKGFLAIEYLLFDASAPDAVLARLTTDTLAARRLTYLQALVKDLDGYGAKFKAAWQLDAFGGAFTEASTNHAAYANPREAIGDVINRLVYITEKIADMKLARPLGLLDGTGVNPALEEAPRSDSSLADAQGTLGGASAAYYGTGPVQAYSLSDLVKISGAPIDARVTMAFDAAEAALTAIPTPFHTTLTTDPTPIATAETKLRALRTVLATEVASNQGATIGFSDNDGD